MEKVIAVIIIIIPDINPFESQIPVEANNGTLQDD